MLSNRCFWCFVSIAARKKYPSGGSFLGICMFCSCACLSAYTHAAFGFVMMWSLLLAHSLNWVFLMFCIDHSRQNVPIWRKLSWYFYIGCSCACLSAYTHMPLFGLLWWGLCAEHMLWIRSLWCFASIAAIKKYPSRASFLGISMFPVHLRSIVFLHICRFFVCMTSPKHVYAYTVARLLVRQV